MEKKHLIAALAVLLCAGAAAAQVQQGGPGQRDMATPSQQKPAEEPQQSVPGPTPQETSGKTDSQNFTGKENATTPQPSAGSSTAPDKLENGEKRK